MHQSNQAYVQLYVLLRTVMFRNCCLFFLRTGARYQFLPQGKCSTKIEKRMGRGDA